MDLAFFTVSACIGVGIGLTMKKNGIYIIPQTVDVGLSNKQYFQELEEEMKQHEFDTYFVQKNSTRNLNSRRR